MRLFHRPDRAAVEGDGRILLDDVHVRLGERDVLRGVSLEIAERRVAVVGANGSGKSTFARLLNGLVAPTRGSVRVHGHDTADDGPAVRRAVGFVFTDPDAQIIMPTVAEDVAYSLRRRGLDAAEIELRVAHALARVGLEEHGDHPAHLLSGGQKQLLAITSVLVTEPRVLVADEPTTLLDLRNTRDVGDRLWSLDQQVVVVTHDLDVAAGAERVLVVDGGLVVADDAPGPAIAAYRRRMA